MKNNLLTQAESDRFSLTIDRINSVMKTKGIESYKELNQIISDKRGSAPHPSTYTRMKKSKEEKSLYNLTIDNLYVIADALDVSIDYLLGIPNKGSEHNIGQINGLSEKALANIENMGKGIEAYVEYSSNFHKTKKEKRMAALNWILEHVDEDYEDDEIDSPAHINANEKNEKYDFLESIYYLIMTMFDKHRYGITEAVIRSLCEKTYEDFDKYIEASSKIEYPIPNGDRSFNGEINKRVNMLKRYRIDFIRRETWNRDRRQIIRQLVENNRFKITDPVTQDSIWVSLVDPYVSIKDNLFTIIERWKKEYGTTVYNELVKRRDEEDMLNLPEDIEYEFFQDYSEKFDSLNDGKENEDVPEEMKYREPYLRDLSESEMKMYMLLLFLEYKNAELVELTDDGEIKTNHSNAYMDDVVEAAQRWGIGICKKSDKYYYDENAAASSHDQLEVFYRNTILPQYLEYALQKKEELTGCGFVTERYIQKKYMESDVTKLVETFKSEGGKYEIKNNMIHLYFEDK